MTRTLSRLETPPPPAPGFLGEGHTAVAVVEPTSLRASDPFVLLADDRLDVAKPRLIGGAHPHAGLQTVTLVLEGTLRDRDEGTLGAGDLLFMTAGRGIIHNEAVETSRHARILQLWIALPTRDRYVAPEFEIVRRDAAPLVHTPGADARLYSGTLGAVRSPTRNLVPVTLIDLVLGPNAIFAPELPAEYNGFVYVLDGSARIGADAIAGGQVGWLAPSSTSALTIAAEARGAHLMLYAGRPIGEPIIQQGPFVAGSQAEILDFHRRFRAGRFVKMSQLAAAT